MSYTENPQECESCGWGTTDLKEIEMPMQADRKPADRDYCWLCQVCYQTRASNVHMYPRQYDHGEIVKTVAWGINYLASLIRPPGASQ